MRFGDYFGFLVLFAVLCSAGVSALSHENVRLLRFPSYGFATVNLVYVFLLVLQYVIRGSTFSFWKFCGEMLILMIGAALFIGLYLSSD
jgi:hypothetical protein